MAGCEVVGARFTANVNGRLGRGWQKVQNESGEYTTPTWKKRGQERGIVTRHSQGKAFSSSAFHRPARGAGEAMCNEERRGMSWLGIEVTPFGLVPRFGSGNTGHHLVTSQRRWHKTRILPSRNPSHPLTLNSHDHDWR